MFRCAAFAVRAIRPLSIPYLNAARIRNDCKSFATCKTLSHLGLSQTIGNSSLLNNQTVLNISKNIVQVPSRSITKFSLNKGKRKSSKSVIKRFFRLHWGGWIRTKVGRQKRLWKKSPAQKRRLRQHVFCNATQSTLLDKMVTKFWRKPKYYVDDPYAPYHTREEFVITRKKPIQRN
ncbi:large ribosomal subunit protein bL35m [Ostrinia nubilalis]|uniref:large ribosomal subunit protein bL35m n=1 Tax=Ostrinia nubilalis TaxID=29057 RepID=UPI0030824638